MLNHKEIWFDTYKGIRFEVNKFQPTPGLGHSSAWTYYIHFYAEQFPESFRPQIMPKVYYSSFGTPFSTYRGPLDNIEWHGGITWSSIENKSGPFTSLKFGCDFQHLWDENRGYSLDDVVGEAKNTIDQLLEKFPEIRLSDDLWKEFRSKFPGDKEPTIYREFDVNGQALPEEEQQQ